MDRVCGGAQRAISIVWILAALLFCHEYIGVEPFHAISEEGGLDACGTKMGLRDFHGSWPEWDITGLHGFYFPGLLLAERQLSAYVGGAQTHGARRIAHSCYGGSLAMLVVACG